MKRQGLSFSYPDVMQSLLNYRVLWEGGVGVFKAKDDRRIKLPPGQLYMYQMTKKPPEMTLNDCIIQYKQTTDELFLLYFLHFYEPKLNARAESFCLQYGQINHFQDIKQTVIRAILEKIDDYDPAKGASLITFTHWHVIDAVHDYIRENCGAVSVSEYDYDNLRNIKAIFNETSEATETERFQSAMEKTGLSEDAIKQHLQYGEIFPRAEDINSGYKDDNDENSLQLIERIGDVYDNVERLVLNKMLYEALVIAVDTLPYKEKRLILDFNGLEMHGNRFRDIDPIDKETLAARLHVGKIQSVDKNVRRAISLLRKELEKSGWIEGKDTPKFIDATKDEMQELTDIDCEIIQYANHKWLESGKQAEFHLLIRNEWSKSELFVRELLKLWLY